MSNVLVVYFSASGRTKKMALEISERLNCDVYEIKPKEAYTSADLNWMDKNSRSSVEMNNRSFRPEIIHDELDLSKYDKIILGFPIWWGIAPTVVNSFLESYDFSNKTVYPFATSGGSGYGESNKLIHDSLGDNVILKDGILLKNINDFITVFL